MSKAIVPPPQTTSHPVYTAFGAEHVDSHPSNIEGGTCLRTAHATTLSPNELTEGPTDTLSPEFERTCRMLNMRPESWPCSTPVAEHRLPHNCYMNAPHTPEGRIGSSCCHTGIPPGHGGQVGEAFDVGAVLTVAIFRNLCSGPYCSEAEHSSHTRCIYIVKG